MKVNGTPALNHENMKSDETFHKLNQENSKDRWEKPCSNIMGTLKQ
jgi:hypothetical protein